MDENWKILVARYADGRPLCNCRCAYLTPCGRGIDAEGRRRTDLPVCESGCSANQITARDEVAARVLAELGSA